MSNPIMSILRTPTQSNPTKQAPLTSSLPKNVKDMSFAQFVKMMKGKDAKGIVDELCLNGQMTTQQRDALVKKAEGSINDFRAFLK